MIDGSEDLRHHELRPHTSSVVSGLDVATSTYLDNRTSKVARQYFVKRNRLFYQQFHILVRAWLRCWSIPPNRVEALDVRRETVTHDCDQLGVNFVLVFLVVAFKLVKLNEHDGLLRGEVPPERLAHVRDERDHDRKGLRGQGEVFRGDVLQTSRAHCTRAENDLTRPRVKGLEELDDARHCICREKAKVDDHFEVVGNEW